MKVYALNVESEDYYTISDLFGIFSSREKAIEYARLRRPELKIYTVDEVTNKDYTYFSIDEYDVDNP